MLRARISLARRLWVRFSTTHIQPIDAFATTVYVVLNGAYTIHICDRTRNAGPLSVISQSEDARQTMGKNCKFPRRKASRPARLSRDDAELLALGRQFDAALAKLLSLQMRNAAVDRIEAFLARMEPIERAILTIPADSIAGAAVKARVAAHVVSNYWDVPLDQLDLDARAFRLLVEAVCNVAGTSLPFPSDVGTTQVAHRAGRTTGTQKA
jgi:hypothetical protein